MWPNRDGKRCLQQWRWWSRWWGRWSTGRGRRWSRRRRGRWRTPTVAGGRGRGTLAVLCGGTVGGRVFLCRRRRRVLLRGRLIGAEENAGAGQGVKEQIQLTLVRGDALQGQHHRLVQLLIPLLRPRTCHRPRPREKASPQDMPIHRVSTPMRPLYPAPHSDPTTRVLHSVQHCHPHVASTKIPWLQHCPNDNLTTTPSQPISQR